MKRQQLRKAVIILCFLLFPAIIFYFSPFLIVLGALTGIVSGSAIMFTLMFVFSMFFGKRFCAYLCPAGGLQECLMLAVDKKAKGGWRNYIKWAIWIPWIATIIVMFVLAGGIAKVDPFFETTNGLSLNGVEWYTYCVYFGVVLLLFALPALTAGRRAFCHYICWMKPFMILGDRLGRAIHLPTLRLKGNPKNCISCGLCDKKCPMSLQVKEMVKREKMADDECILCGECIDVCPKKCIKYSRKRK